MTEKTKQVVQVVKRFGLCGGMEEYVFRLAESLNSLGYNVLVLCEEKVNLPASCELKPQKITFYIATKGFQAIISQQYTLPYLIFPVNLAFLLFANSSMKNWKVEKFLVSQLFA